VIELRDLFEPTVIGCWFAQSISAESGRRYKRWMSCLYEVASVRHLVPHVAVEKGNACAACQIAIRKHDPEKWVHSNWLSRAVNDYIMVGCGGAYGALVTLAQDPLLEPPEDGAWDTLRAVLDIARTFPADSSAMDLMKAVRKLVPGRDNAMTLVSTLGSAGVLAAQGHPSPFEQFIRADESAPRRKFRSDLSYPVQHWQGSDGVDERAVEYWFGSI